MDEMLVCDICGMKYKPEDVPHVCVRTGKSGAIEKANRVQVEGRVCQLCPKCFPNALKTLLIERGLFDVLIEENKETQ